MNNIWHNSNEEQPDSKRRTVCYCLNTNGGEVGIHTMINPNYRWAYLEDLDHEYVQCGNCVNDKGCIDYKHGEQKKTNVMNTPLEKVKREIEHRIETLKLLATPNNTAIRIEYNVYNNVLSLINSISKESINENHEKSIQS